MPVVLYGNEYWDEVINFDAFVRWGTVSAKELQIFYKTDSVDDAYKYLTEDSKSFTRRLKDWIRLSLPETSVSVYQGCIRSSQVCAGTNFTGRNGSVFQEPVSDRVCPNRYKTRRRIQRRKRVKRYFAAVLCSVSFGWLGGNESECPRPTNPRYMGCSGGCL